MLKYFWSNYSPTLEVLLLPSLDGLSISSFLFLVLKTKPQYLTTGWSILAGSDCALIIKAQLNLWSFF